MGRRTAYLFRSFLLPFLVCLTATSFADKHAREKEFEAARKEHEENYKRPVSYQDPRELNKSLAGGLCTYRGFCRYFAKNALKPFLYQDSAGFKVPNTNFLRIDETLSACLTHKKESILEPLHRIAAEDYEKFEKTLDKGERKRYAKLYAWAQDNPPNPDADEFKEDSLEESLVALSGYEIAKNEKVFDQASKDAYLKYLRSMEQRTKLETAPFPEWEILANDYLVSPSLYEKTKPPPDFKDHTDRAASVFKSAQSDLLDLLKERTTGSNRAAMEGLATRLKLIKFAVPTPGSPLPSTCSSLNAYFSPDIHTIVVCPQYLRMPIQALRNVIGHELGHVIDPCRNSCPLCQQKKPPVQATEVVVSEAAPTSHSEPQLTTLAGDSAESYHSPAVAVEFRSNGATTLEGEKIMAYAEKASDYPFKSVVDCLGGFYSVKARTRDAKKITAALGRAYQDLVRSGANPNGSDATFLEDVKKNAPRLLAEKGPCNFVVDLMGGREITGEEKDQRTEAFADWVAKELSRRHFKNKVAMITSDGSQTGSAVELLSSFAGECTEVKEAVQGYFAKLAKKVGCEDYVRPASSAMESQLLSYLDSHPTDMDRYERIFLSSPDIAKSMGCPVTPDTKDCL